jgi:hypothetical protein
MKVFISTLNWLVKDVFKNKEYSYFATIVLLTGCEVLTFLFIFDFSFYHLLDNRELIVNDDRILGTILISIIFIFNLWFYKNRLNKYNLDFSIIEDSKKRNIKILSVLYLILIISLIMYNSYLIRYNLKIF